MRESIIQKSLINIGKKVAECARNDASLLMCYQVEENEEVRQRIEDLQRLAER